MEHLSDQRSEGSAGLNNRAFGAEWSAGADGDRGRDWLQNRDLWFDTAAIGENGFHSLGNPVSTNFARTILGHQPNDDSTDHRNDDHPITEMMLADADHLEADVVKENQVRE